MSPSKIGSKSIAATTPEEEEFTKPPLSSLISVHDFEDVARKTYSAKTFAFYSSAATDLVTLRANSEFHKRLLLRPRCLRNVGEVRTSRSILGLDSSAPFFVSPAAMAKLAHPDGELAIARGCGNQGIIQTVSLTPKESSFTPIDFKILQTYRYPPTHHSHLKTSWPQDSRTSPFFCNYTSIRIAPRQRHC